MILYITKKTKDRFNIPLYSELTDELELLARNILVKEQDDIFKWGVKIFVNVNIKMYKKWKIKMYNLGSTIHQLSYHQ